MKNLLWIVCAAGVLLSLNGNTLQAHPRFDITDLGPISTSFDQGSQPTVQYYSLNNAGQIVGVRLPNYDVFIWQNGTTTDLGIQGTPVKINDSGQIVINSKPEGKIYFWENGTITDLADTFGDAVIKALALNNPGRILLSHTASGSISYKIWEKGTVANMENLPADLKPCAMNNNNEVLCWPGLLDDSSTHMYLWKDNQVTDLGIIKAADASSGNFVLRMNDSLQITFSDVLWQNGQTSPLGSLPFVSFRPFYLNNNGQMVGIFHVTVNPSWGDSVINYGEQSSGSISFCFYEDGVARPILGLVDNNVFSIFLKGYSLNDKGQMIIQGWSNNVAHALLLTPNGQTDTDDPQPSSDSQVCSQYFPFLIGILVLGYKGLSFTAGHFGKSISLNFSTKE